MTGVAIDLMRQITQAGGTVRLEGDALRLSAPGPLADELRARLRQHKAQILALLSAAEPANNVVLERQSGQDVGGLPRAVGDGIRAVLSTDYARGIPPQRWPQVQRDVTRLVEGGWAQQALGLGWTSADLFGCDQRAPWYRLDRCGLVLLTGGREVVELTADGAALRTSTGSVLRFRRRPPARPPVALLWQLLTPARATGPPIRGPTAHPDEGADGGDVLGRTPPPS
jgi:hypothetical protein